MVTLAVKGIFVLLFLDFQWEIELKHKIIFVGKEVLFNFIQNMYLKFILLQKLKEFKIYVKGKVWQSTKSNVRIFVRYSLKNYWTDLFTVSWKMVQAALRKIKVTEIRDLDSRNTVGGGECVILNKLMCSESGLN